MTRIEYTNTRDLTFSRWIRERLPDSSTGFSVTDIDFVMWNWSPGKERMMLVEVKTHGASLSTGQKMHMRRMDEWIRSGMMTTPEWHYFGMFVITFEGAGFDDGPAYIQNIQSDTKHQVTEAELAALLSLD